jgi:hypothetical protein
MQLEIGAVFDGKVTGITNTINAVINWQKMLLHHYHEDVIICDELFKNLLFTLKRE